MNMFASTAKALNQDKIAHRQLDRVDRALHHRAIAVQQRHMRRESRCYSAESGILHRATKQPMERKIPSAEKGWPATQCVRWFRTFAMNVSQIYDGDAMEPVELKIDLEEAAN